MLAVSGVYKTLLALHLLTVILGFGVVMMAGFFGAEAKARRGPGGLAIAEATYNVITKYCEKLIYAVPVFGILLVLTSPNDVYKFSQPWIGISMLLYIAALGIVHGVHLPNIRRMNALMAELAAGPPPGAGGAGGPGGPPPQVAELEERGKKAGMFGGLLSLMAVVIVILMVFKPGL